MNAARVIALYGGKDPEHDALRESNYDWFRGWFIERFGVAPKESQGRVSIWRLKGPARGTSRSTRQELIWGGLNEPPRTDHQSIWLAYGRAVAFVSEPYLMVEEQQDLHGWADRNGILEWAERWGFDVTLNKRSWWVPNDVRGYGTVLVIYTVRRDNRTYPVAR